MQAFRRLFHLLLEIIGGVLLTGLAVLVSVAAAMRYLGKGLSFYDELAPILLAWVAFFGAALVALNRGHLGFDNVVRALPTHLRGVAFAAAELLTILFFAALAWGGHRLVELMRGEHLVTLTWVSTSLTLAVMPAAAIAFIVAELLTIPEAWRRLSDPPVPPMVGAEPTQPH